MKVYIEDWSLSGSLSSSLFSAYLGFREKSFSIHTLARPEDVDSVEVTLDPKNPVVGSFPFVQRGMAKLSRTFPRFEPYPNPLRKFMDREPKDVSFSQLREEAQTLGFRPVVIKPRHDKTLFRGTTIKSFQDLLEFSYVPLDTRIWQVKFVPLLAEYKAFFFRNDLVWISLIKGSPLATLNPDTLKRISIAARKIDSVAFTVDLGVAEFLERPEQIRWPTLVLTANDFYSVEGHGLPPRLYSDMLETRWEQMTK